MKVFSVLAISALAIGCGSSDEPATTGGTLNETGARQNVQNATKGIADTIDNNQGESGVNQIMAGVAAPSVTPAAGAGLGSGGLNLAAGPGCECAANSCTFTNCKPSEGVTINGSYAWGNGKLTCTNFTWEIANAQGGGGVSASNTKLTLNCDISYVAGTSIDGTITSTGETTVSGLTGPAADYANVSWKTKMVFKAVGYAQGTPKSGSVEYTGSYTAGGKEYGAQKTFTYPQ